MRLKILFPSTLVPVILLIGTTPALFGAEVSQEAKTQLVTQAEEFRKKPEKIAPKPEEKPEIVTEGEEKAEAEEGGPGFFLRKIKLEDNTLFSEKDLAAYTSKFENRQTTFSELQSLAQLITNHYRAQGYTTSRAYIPPQTIENETAVIRVVEGKVGKIIVEGSRWFKTSLYEEAIRLRKDRVFRYQDLETSLYFLNQKPDRKARAYLSAGVEPGTSDITLKAEETFPLHAYYEFNNRGTKLTHRARHLTHLDHNNLTGNGDIFNSSLSLSEEGAFTAGSLDYRYPFEKTGTTVRLSFSYAESMLVKHLKPAEVKGESLTFIPEITQAFVKEPTFVLEGSLGFEIKDSKTLIDDFKTDFDRMRVLRAGPRMTLQDAGGRTYLSSDVHWGIPRFLGSSPENDPNASRTNSGGDFMYYTFNAARVQQLPVPAWFLIARGNAQWTRDTLTSLEQYRLGGAYTVRGYPESDTLGDYGYNFSTELSVPPPFVPPDWQVPFSPKKWQEALRFIGFVDGGKAYTREREFDPVVKDRFLLGVGWGVRFDLDRLFSLQTDFGWPIGDTSADEDQMQFHVSLTAGF